MKPFVKLLLIFLFVQTQILPQLNTPNWAYDAVIYEVNIRQFTKEGTFKAFQKHLPQLKEMGVGIIWLMPINPIGEKNRKGTLGSYYSVKNYKEINPEFGTKADFKNLVDEIHKLGMHVIVDWVANHTAWDNPWVADHPEFYTKDSLGNFVAPVADWADVVDLNYDNKDLWKEMINALEYWVKDFNIDGYRCDVAGMVPIEFWNEARIELDKIKSVFMLAEWETPEMHKKAFEMTYAWEIYKLMNEIYKGNKNAEDLRKQIISDLKKYPDYAFRMQFTSNHDENTWNGTEFERLGDATEMFAAFTNVIPGMPLIYNGQEAGFNRRLAFFDKDSIDWKQSTYFELYKKLFHLKKDNQALWNGLKGGKIEFVNTNDNKNILAFIRYNNADKVLTIFNMSKKEKSVTLDSEFIEGDYFDFKNGSKVHINNKLNLILQPWTFKIFSTKKY
jgi:glycosidase